MDNGERGRRLMAMATEYLQDMEASYARKSWNAVVRRAQEVVELSLKGVLSYLGVDFPKVHDPAAVFVATVSASGRMALGTRGGGGRRAPHPRAVHAPRRGHSSGFLRARQSRIRVTAPTRYIAWRITAEREDGEPASSFDSGADVGSS